MKFSLRNPFWVLGLVLLWRAALLVFTAQPIPANDAFIFDGALANWLHGGHYVNPCLSVAYPISSGQIFSIYPPIYQLALLLWMLIFGTSALAVMWLHLIFFGLAAALTLMIWKKYFPAVNGFALLALLLLGITFNDRPEDLAHVFGLASLLLVSHQMARASSSPALVVGTALTLWLTLYTSVIVGAFYFGAGFLACAAAWWWSRKSKICFLPFVIAALMFAVVTITIAGVKPLWWRGFLENATKQSVVGGFHLPRGMEVLKLIRSAPVFLLAAALAPLILRRRPTFSDADRVGLCLLAGIFVMGWILLVLALTLLAPNYIFYTLFTQVLLAVGLLALVRKLFPAAEARLRRVLWVCVILVSIRAVGMTTWGAACAWQNSYASTQQTLRYELEPFAKTNLPVVIGSQFLYGAQAMGVLNPIHSDWYFDRAQPNPDANFNGIVRLRPTKLVLSQFDYYRAFVPLLERLRQHPELVTVRVRDLAQVRPPDAIPAFSRVVQHVSWAPVIVDLDWKNPPTP